MNRLAASLLLLLGTFVLLPHACGAGTTSTLDEKLQQVIEQNEKLQQQVAAQQQVIDGLRGEVQAIRNSDTKRDEALRAIAEKAEPDRSTAVPHAASDVKLRISGETGLAFFRTDAEGPFPRSEFRVDDARLWVEAQVWKNTYAVAGLEFMTRESGDDLPHFAEWYVDFEEVAEKWGAPDLLNVRVGRFSIPFGEEYQSRLVLANPLISHSVADLWGYDEGLEAFGRVGAVSYVVAVQNGGLSAVHDYTSDKSLVVRLGADPLRFLHLSASAMRTGTLTTAEPWSAIWFGNGFFRAIGPAASKFQANLYELDAVGTWSTGHLGGAVGWVDFDDNSPARSSRRSMDYFSGELVQAFAEGWYGAVRYSGVHAPRGYPLVGWSGFGPYFLGSTLTRRLDRLSFGLGYHVSPPVTLKFEYTQESRRTLHGADADRENVLATELGLKF